MDALWPERPVGFWPLNDMSGSIAQNLSHTTPSDGSGGGAVLWASLNGGVTKQHAGPAGTRLAMALDGTNGTYINLGAFSTRLGTAQPQSFMVAVYLAADLSSATTGFCPFGTSTANVYVIGLGSFTGSLTNEVVSVGNGSGLRVGWSGFTVPAGWHVFVVTFGGASNTDWTCFIDGRDAVADLGGTLISAGGGCAGFSTQTFTLGRFTTTSYAVTLAAAGVFDQRVNRFRARHHAHAILYS